MKHLKLFENFDSVTEEQIENYLKEHFTSDWFDRELSERVYDYIGSEEAEDYEGDYEEAYKNLSTGGAIEYDLLKVMADEVSENFEIDADTKIDKRNIRDICHDHLIDTCQWYDKWTFNRRSTEPYKNPFFGNSYQDLLKNWDPEKETSFKLEKYDFEDFTHSDMEMVKELYEDGMEDPNDISREMDIPVEIIKQILHTLKKRGDI